MIAVKNVILYAIFLIVAVYGCYGLIYQARKEKKCWETLFWSLLLVAGNSIFVALILTIADHYSIRLFLLIQYVELIIFFVFLKMKSKLLSWKQFSLSFKGIRPRLSALIILVAALFLYMAFPTNYMTGFRDPGLYYLNGIRIAETGSIQFESDEYINEHYDELKDLVKLGYSGIYSDYTYYGEEGGAQPGDLTAQFMPMFSSILAVGYDLGAIAVLIRVNGIIAVLALLAIYYFAKRFFGSKTAVISILFMLLCPAQLWGARLTETEILAQLFFFVSMYIVASGWREKVQWKAILGGLLLGIGVLNRIDVFIFGIGIFFVLGYCGLFRREKLKYMLFCSSGYLLTGGLALLYGFMCSKPYILDHLENGSLSGILLGNIVVLGLALIACLAGCFYKKNNSNWLLSTITNKKGAAWVGITLLALFLVAYFIRPLLPNHDDQGMIFAHHAMTEFCWYTSVVAALIAIYGIYYYLRSKKKRVEVTFLFLVICISNILIYIYRPSITPDHIWAARRWITVCIPFVLIMAAYGSEKLIYLFCKGKSHKKVGKFLRICIVCTISGVLFYQSAPFIFTPMLAHLDLQYQELAQQLDDDEIYFSDCKEITGFLRYVYHKNVYYMPWEEEESYQKYISKNGGFYYIGKGEWLNNTEWSDVRWDAEEIIPFTMQGKYLDRSFGAPARNVIDREIAASVYFIKGIEKLQEESIYIRSLDSTILNPEPIRFHKKSGRADGGKIISQGLGEIVLYGPYMFLEKGTYEVCFEISGGENSEIGGRVEVYTNDDDNVWAEKQFCRDGKVKLRFEMTEDKEGVEFRIWDEPGSIFECSEFLIQKIDS